MEGKYKLLRDPMVDPETKEPVGLVIGSLFERGELPFSDTAYTTPKAWAPGTMWQHQDSGMVWEWNGAKMKRAI
jgi:hypothetical protein